MKRLLIIFAFLWGLTFGLLAQNERLPQKIQRIDDQMRGRYAPDSRVAIFRTDYTVDGNKVMLRGKTDNPRAKADLLQELQAQGYEVMDCMKLLPEDASLGERTWGVVNVSVCNLRVGPDYGEEQSTQGLLGMPVRILERDGWYRVQTPDDYIGWVHGGQIQRMTAQELSNWNAAEQVVVTAVFAQVFEQPDEESQTVSDVVASNRLKLLGKKKKFYFVEYPDGRRGYLLKTCGQPVKEWRTSLKHDAQSIIATGKKLIGVPYLWGGTSTKGVDCSGFVRTTLMMHDILIPRDASQQAKKGELISTNDGYDNLQAGDLLFFGSKASGNRPARVSHVGIYMGGKRFIHSIACVHLSSFDPTDELYDESETNRLLFGRRILSQINKEKGLTTTDQNRFYGNVENWNE